MTTGYADLPHLGPQARALLDRLVASGDDGVERRELVDWVLARLLKLGYAVESPRDRSRMVHTPEGLHRWQAELLAAERRATDKLRRQLVRERLEARFEGFQFAPAGPGPMRPVRIEPFRLLRQPMPAESGAPAPRRRSQPAYPRLPAPVGRFTGGLTVVPQAEPIDPELSDATLKRDADQPEAAAGPTPPATSRRWIYGAAAVVVGAAAASALLFIQTGNNDSARPESEHPTIVAAAEPVHAAAAPQDRLPATPQPAAQHGATAPAKPAEPVVTAITTTKTAPAPAIVRGRPQPTEAAAGGLARPTSPAQSAAPAEPASETRQRASAPVPPMRVAEQAAAPPAAHPVPSRVIMSDAQAPAPPPSSPASAPAQTAPAQPATPAPVARAAAIETPRQAPAEPAPPNASPLPAAQADAVPPATAPVANPSSQPAPVPQPATVAVAENAPPARTPGETGSAQVHLVPRASRPAEESQPVPPPLAVAATGAGPVPAHQQTAANDAPAPAPASASAPKPASGEPDEAAVATRPLGQAAKDQPSPTLPTPGSAAPTMAENTGTSATGLAASAAPPVMEPAPAPLQTQPHFSTPARAIAAATPDRLLPHSWHKGHPAAAAGPAHPAPTPALTDHEQVEQLNAQSLAAAKRGRVWRPSAAVRRAAAVASSH